MSYKFEAITVNIIKFSTQVKKIGHCGFRCSFFSSGLAVYENGTGTRGQGHWDVWTGTWDSRM